MNVEKTIEIEIRDNDYCAARIYLVRNPDGTLQTRSAVSHTGRPERFGAVHNLAFNREDYNSENEAVNDAKRTLKVFFSSNGVPEDKLKILNPEFHKDEGFLFDESGDAIKYQPSPTP